MSRLLQLTNILHEYILNRVYLIRQVHRHIVTSSEMVIVVLCVWLNFQIHGFIKESIVLQRYKQLIPVIYSYYVCMHVLGLTVPSGKIA